MTDRKATLNAELIELHGRLEEAARLSALHEEAARDFAEGPEDARFHLTHAWVFALVAGDDARVAALEARLRTAGGLV